MSSAFCLQSHPLGQLSKTLFHRPKVATGGLLQDVETIAREETVVPAGEAFVGPYHLFVQLPEPHRCHIPLQCYLNLFSLVVGSRFSV